MPSVPDSPNEVVIDEMETGPEVRRVRVYDNKGDFIIDVPPECVITFGYFNPTPSSFNSQRGGGWDDGHGRNVAKQTALRIRAKGSKENQLAVFLGVNGFRDESIKLTRLRERVVIEQNYVDDGEGEIVVNKKQNRQLVAAPEPDTYS